MSKAVCRISGQVSHISDCRLASWQPLNISDVEAQEIILSTLQMTKVLINLQDHVADQGLCFLFTHEALFLMTTYTIFIYWFLFV